VTKFKTALLLPIKFWTFWCMARARLLILLYTRVKSFWNCALLWPITRCLLELLQTALPGRPLRSFALFQSTCQYRM